MMDQSMELRKPEEPYDWRQDWWLSQPFYSKDFGAAVMEKFRAHARQWDTNTPIGEAVWTAYRVYHGLTDSVSPLTLSSPVVSLVETGEYGEFLSLSANHFRGLIRHQIALVTADRPTWDPQARTSGSEASKQVTLTRNILDYYMSAKRFDQKLYEQFELATVCGSAFQAIGWDARAGLDGQGDLWSCVLAPWECATEKVRAYEDTTWHIFRRMESRADWAAHLAETDPEKARQLFEMDPDKSILCGVRDQKVGEGGDAERIPVLYVYASATKACPKGRLAIVASDDLVLVDGPLPYGQTAPITRICASEFLGTSIPCANSWSQLPLMEAYKAVMSAIMTRIDIGAVPDIVTEDGVDFEQGMLGGANLLKKPPGSTSTAELLDLLQIPNALPNIADMFKKTMEELSGINSVTRGNPAENITSGSMAALVQSMAVQFNNAEERTYAFNLEATGTNVIRVIQRMATKEQLISIAGQDEQWTIQKFIGEDLNQILRVAVKTASAMTKTLTGRKEIADQLLNAKMIEDPRQYLKAIETGNLSPLFKSAVDQLDIVKEENERLGRGEPAVVLPWDHHGIHVREHLCELSTGARYDRARRESLQAHLQEHIDVWGQMSREAPDMLEAIGCPPLTQAFAVGQQAMQMQAGAPPTEQPSQVAPQKMPGAAEQKSKPGPAPAPPGQEPSQAVPSLPKPATAPTPEAVV